MYLLSNTMDETQIVRKPASPKICDLPADVLILVLSRLHGQDIARCNMVRRCLGFKLL